MTPYPSHQNNSQSTLQESLTNTSTSSLPPLLNVPRSRSSSSSTTNSKNTGQRSQPSLTLKSFKRKQSRRRSIDSVVPLGDADSSLANEKRNKEFHAIFKSIPTDDSLIEDYGCALQKDILLQGRLYVSQRHICFNANIFGWVTNVVIAYTDILEIERKTTAIIIPNAIQITTRQSKHFFASFLSREHAYDQLVDLWKQYVDPVDVKVDAVHGHSDIATATAMDMRVPMVTMDAATAVDERALLYDDPELDEDLLMKPMHHKVVSVSPHDQERQNSLASLPVPRHLPITEEDRAAAASRRRAMSEAGPRPSTEGIAPASPPPQAISSASSPSQGLPASSAMATTVPAAGAAQIAQSTASRSSASTQCQCESHYPHVVMDQTYNCSMETLYQLLYHTDFIKKYLVDVEKCSDVQIGAWQKSEDVPLVRDVSYTKYLGGAIGPKSTKCILKEEITHLDLQSSITQQTTTQTPDVPSGSSFCVKTRVCTTKAEKGMTRIVVTVLVSFSKTSWLKSTIEKASIDGQINYYKGLDMAIRKYTVSLHMNRSENATATRRKRHGKRKHHGHHHHQHQVDAGKENNAVQQGLAGLMDQLVAQGIALVRGIYEQPLSLASCTVLCMIAIVLTNCYIALKMSSLGHQLRSAHLATSNASSLDAWRVTHHDQVASIWQWLDERDPEPPVTQHQPMDFARYQPYAAPVQVLELEKKMFRVEQSVDQIAHLVKLQRQRLLQEIIN